MILTTLLVLTLCVMAGCGCRNSKPAATTEATMPMATTVPTTEAATAPTTMATTAPTEATIQDGNGPVTTDATTATDEAGNARSRGGIMPGGAGTGNGITGSIS